MYSGGGDLWRLREIERDGIGGDRGDRFGGGWVGGSV